MEASPKPEEFPVDMSRWGRVQMFRDTSWPGDLGAEPCCIWGWQREYCGDRLYRSTQIPADTPMRSEPFLEIALLNDDKRPIEDPDKQTQLTDLFLQHGYRPVFVEHMADWEEEPEGVLQEAA